MTRLRIWYCDAGSTGKQYIYYFNDTGKKQKKETWHTFKSTVSIRSKILPPENRGLGFRLLHRVAAGIRFFANCSCCQRRRESLAFSFVWITWKGRLICLAVSSRLFTISLGKFRCIMERIKIVYQQFTLCLAPLGFLIHAEKDQRKESPDSPNIRQSQEPRAVACRPFT